MPDDSCPRRLILPPPYDQHFLASGDVMEAAKTRAIADGAGALVWQLRPGRLDFAVVLEPDQPLAQARLAFLAGMVALGDAVAAHCGSERAVAFGWPGEVILDAGRLGGARFAVAPGCAAEDVPDWMVFGAELIADRDQIAAPGDYPESISLKEEEITDPAALVESFSAYLMLRFDRWRHDGIDAVIALYAERLNQPLPELDGLATAIDTAHWRDATGPRL
jgi:biotin-(acetyl-CoA carboxylase) ligase